MVTAIEPLLREQLIQRRQKLEAAAHNAHQEAQLGRLLQEVDEALLRMEAGTYGLCEVCHDPVETERLLADPLTRVCIGDLTPPERRALEDDLQLAAQIQNGLLPQPSLSIDGWEVAYHYEPAGLVSGDYCDLITSDGDNLHFALGDVSGKGVAASMLMAHLQAMFRTLVSIKVPLDQMLSRASSVFCESTLPTHYATLVFGNVKPNGSVQLSNAGHLPPLVLRNGQVETIDSAGLPLGMFGGEQFSVSEFRMEKGDTLFLYTDGFSEGLDREGQEFGLDRISRLLNGCQGARPTELISNCLREINAFRASDLPADDLTLMAIQRVH